MERGDMTGERRAFGSRRRRAPLGFGASYGFLRPPRRQEEDQELFRERLRTEPELRREYRTSLAVQLTVVGALLAAVVAFVVQMIVLVRRAPVALVGNMGWTLPVLIGLLALLVLRRFLRLLADYRGMGPK